MFLTPSRRRGLTAVVTDDRHWPIESSSSYQKNDSGICSSISWTLSADSNKETSSKLSASNEDNSVAPVAKSNGGVVNKAESLLHQSLPTPAGSLTGMVLDANMNRCHALNKKNFDTDSLSGEDDNEDSFLLAVPSVIAQEMQTADHQMRRTKQRRLFGTASSGARRSFLTPTASASVTSHLQGMDNMRNSPQEADDERGGFELAPEYKDEIFPCAPPKVGDEMTDSKDRAEYELDAVTYSCSDKKPEARDLVTPPIMSQANSPPPLSDRERIAPGSNNDAAAAFLPLPDNPGRSEEIQERNLSSLSHFSCMYQMPTTASMYLLQDIGMDGGEPQPKSRTEMFSRCIN
jgi:hypothetical protein